MGKEGTEGGVALGIEGDHRGYLGGGEGNVLEVLGERLRGRAGTDESNYRAC